MRGRFAAIIMAMLLLGLSCLMQANQAKIADTQTTRGDTPERHAVHMGIYMGEDDQVKSRIERLESYLKKPFHIVHVYTGFDREFAEFRSSKLDPLNRQNTVPLISWAPGVAQGILYNEIAKGRQDDFIRRWAQGIRDWGKPVFIRFAYEMNMTNMAWNGSEINGGPEKFVQSWQRIHQIFEEEGADNVRWVWCPHAERHSPYYTNLMQYYPGDAYVDWIGLDGYHWGGGYGKETLTFDGIFKKAYKTLEPKGKPMMIAEIGTNTDDIRPAQWLSAAYQHVVSDYPLVEAIVYFNADFSNRGEKDWCITHHTDTLDALKAISDLPAFSPPVESLLKYFTPTHQQEVAKHKPQNVTESG